MHWSMTRSSSARSDSDDRKYICAVLVHAKSAENYHLPVRTSDACRPLRRHLSRSGLPTDLCGRSVNQTLQQLVHALNQACLLHSFIHQRALRLTCI